MERLGAKKTGKTLVLLVLLSPFLYSELWQYVKEGLFQLCSLQKYEYLSYITTSRD
jgi:hypothetical protein